MLSRCGIELWAYRDALRAEQTAGHCAACDRPLVMTRKDRLICGRTDCRKEYRAARGRDDARQRAALWWALVGALSLVVPPIVRPRPSRVTSKARRRAPLKRAPHRNHPWRMAI